MVLQLIDEKKNGYVFFLITAAISCARYLFPRRSPSTCFDCEFLYRFLLHAYCPLASSFKARSPIYVAFSHHVCTRLCCFLYIVSYIFSRICVSLLALSTCSCGLAKAQKEETERARREFERDNSSEVDLGIRTRRQKRKVRFSNGNPYITESVERYGSSR